MISTCKMNEDMPQMIHFFLFFTNILNSINLSQSFLLYDLKIEDKMMHEMVYSFQFRLLNCYLFLEYVYFKNTCKNHLL